MLVIRRHRAGNIVNQTCLFACHTVEGTAYAYAFSRKAANYCPQNACTALCVNQGLHAVPAADTALGREQMRQHLSQRSRMKLLTAHCSALGNSNYAFGSADNIIGTYFILSIFQNSITDIIVMSQNSCRHRNNLIFFHTLTSPPQPYPLHIPSEFYHTIQASDEQCGLHYR